MKLGELQGKTPDQLRDTVLAFKKEMLTLRFQVTSGEAKNPNEMKKLRRTIARAKTLLRQQVLGINPSPDRGEARRGAKHAKPEQASPHPNPPPAGEGKPAKKTTAEEKREEA